MAEKVTNIAKNTSYYTLALIMQKIISFAYFTLLARALGPEDLGKYYFAMSFTTIFAIFIDLGLSSVLTREIARDKQRPGELLSSVLLLKIPLGIITVAIALLTASILGYSDIVKMLIYVSAVSMLLDSFTTTFFAVSRGFHNLGFESISSVAYQSIVLLTGFIMLKMEMGLVWLMAALAFASIFNFLYSGWLVFIKFRVSLSWRLDLAFIKYFVGVTIPFAVYGISQRLYTYFDTILLGHFAGDKAVGIYQIAFKIIFALQFLPLAFTASLYPAMSRYWSNNRSQLGITFERAMNYLIIISLPIAVGIIVIADKVILIFSRGYDDAVLPLQINMLALLFLFVGYPIGSLLNACDRQKTNTMNIIITLIASIGLNLLLIPNWQAVGASVTVAATNFLMFCLGIIRVPAIIGYKPWPVLSVLAKAILAAAFMSLLTYWLEPRLNIFITIIISGLAYFLLLFTTKAFRQEDIASILASFRKNTLPAE